MRWARCDIKSTNLLAAVLAKEEAKEAGADEALFLDPEGVVREGGSSNVFAVLNGVIRTHPLSNRILGGITRLHVIEIARELGYTVEERAFSLADITSAAPGRLRGLHRFHPQGHAAGGTRGRPPGGRRQGRGR